MLKLRPGPVILNADDYGIAAGVSQGIYELADAGRISATSAIVTLPRWATDARRLKALRPKIAIGLHINLTLGKPLGPMPKLAPDNVLPTVGVLVQRALKRAIDPLEIETEVTRQVALFEREAGFAPDHVDGHQHVHVLPGVRRGVLASLAAWFPGQKPLLRDPCDRMFSICGRGGEMAKAFGIAALSLGFKFQARRLGFPTNNGFSGFSSFDPERMYEIELAGAMRMTAAGHIVMCHPGYADEELRALDPVVERRGQELEAIRVNPELPNRIWRPERVTADRPDAPLAWGKVFGHGA